ncbi:10429_t:CDS:2, partial [Ambispora gerdemannii]
MPTIIDHELSQHKNIEFSSDLSDKSLNAYTLLQGTEEVLDEFEEEEYGVKNDIHNIVEEHSEVEHISDITHTEIDYLDLGNFIEHEIQELTAGAHIDGVANIIYQTHLLVCLDVTMVQSKTAKDIAELVITEIESGDDYSWNFKKADLSRKFGSTVGRFSYVCCQLKEAQREQYKDSNHKRRMRYDCKGKIIIRVDTILNVTTVDIYHGSLHPRPNLCIETPEELRQEIKINSHLTIVDLKNHLRNKGFDISKYSPKRIYYWKSMAVQKLFQRNNNHVEFTCKLLSEHEIHGFHWCLNIKDSEATAIGFTTPLLKEIKNRNISITEIYLNATYKTARGRYELY